MSYAAAIEEYEQAFRKDASSIPHARHLAECYWFLRDLKNAERWYAVVASSSQAEEGDIYRYAELLRLSGQFEDSEVWMKRFAKLRPDDSRIKLKENAPERIMELMEAEGLTHKLFKAGFNSEYADMSPFIHGDSLVFSSSRVDGYASRQVHSWNGQPFLNLYSGRLGKDGTVSGIKPLADLNTRYHESNAIVANDGTEMYYTRNSQVETRNVLSKESVNNLQIMVRRRAGKGWSNEVPFRHNNPAYSVGHPALTRDGQRLFFTSDMPGGRGGTDIYVCYREGNGAWSEPENVGSPINTEGDEMFPYVHENVLYFASDGHMGLGGLDLFRTVIRDQFFGAVENLGIPINSTADDFGICLDGPGELGFLTSDRDDAIGGENIYWFRMHSKPDDDRVWAGRILDVNDAQPVPFLTVRLLDMQRNELARCVTGLNGYYEFHAPNVPAMISAKIQGGSQVELLPNEFTTSVFGDTEVPTMYLNSVMDLPVNVILRDAMTEEWLDGVTVTIKDLRDGSLVYYGITDALGITRGSIPDRRYGDDVQLAVTFSKPGYLSKSMEVDFRVLMFLEQALMGPDGTSLSPITSGVDMASAMNLRPIYFDFREHVIRRDAAAELDLVAQAMRMDPSIMIDLRSHTDSRASTEYNDALSQRRAESTRNYLVAQGIAASRITYKGYGERRLVNQCADGVECTELEHQVNRRTEFIITGCKDCGALPAAIAR
ncbi:MAG: OmpA family protein [Flavobacteriales bacterium]|nr:OmpA family protein [Flavobacteriales bacterium]